MLDRKSARVAEARISRKQPLSDEEMTKLLGSVDEVVLARGKSVRPLKASAVKLDELRGPTGGFRAPIVKVGRRLLVGFHDETLKTLLAG